MKQLQSAIALDKNRAAMTSGAKVALFLVIYLLVLQVGIPYLAPVNIIYDQRLNYDLVKNRPSNIEAVLERVKMIIKEEHLEDYVVILGDSVAYSRPGPANASITYYLNERAKKEDRRFRVFNLAMPAMQTGDIYTVLLLMKKYGISSDHVIFNVYYAGFLPRGPGNPSVYWLQQQLKENDLKTYRHVEKNLLAGAPEEKKESLFVQKTESLKSYLYSSVSMLKYKDYFQAYFKEAYLRLRGKAEPLQEVQPWYQKSFLKDLLKEPVYQAEFSDVPMVMDEANLQIYFLNKIMEMQKGKDTLIFLAAMNDELLKENVSKPGYKSNMKKINAFFADKQVGYIDFNRKIDNKYFSDHVHLTPEGYEVLSGELWQVIESWQLDL